MRAITILTAGLFFGSAPDDDDEEEAAVVVEEEEVGVEAPERVM